ncbi:hypothetical protein NQZ68_036205, partial [Dissostichus eleginoides]
FGEQALTWSELVSSLTGKGLQACSPLFGCTTDCLYTLSPWPRQTWRMDRQRFHRPNSCQDILQDPDHKDIGQLMDQKN